MDQEPTVMQVNEAPQSRHDMGKSWPRAIFVVLAIIILLEVIWAIKVLMEPAEKLTTPPDQAAEVDRPNISLLAESKTYKVSEEINVGIGVSTGTSVADGVDVSLKYDPAVLTVLEDSFVKGSVFGDFPFVRINPQTGVVQISGISTPGSKGFQGVGHFGNLVFKAKKAAKTVVSVTFSPGSTADSNIIEQQTAKDILEQVANLELTIQ